MSELTYDGKRESQRLFRGARMGLPDMSMGFWMGRQFRAYRELTANAQLRFHATRDFLLQFQNLYCDNGELKIQIFTGSTPSGVWSMIPTQNAKNRIGAAALVVAANECQAGGTFTGGTERELLKSDSGGGQGVGFENRLGTSRGLPAGDYYFQVTVTGTTYGIYTLEWEELDTVAGVPV